MESVIETTRELRHTPRMHCPLGDQRCHNVGLNLMKRIVNYYAEVRELPLSGDEFALLKRDLNDARRNLRCCSVRQNSRDKDVERELLQYLFHGEPLENEAARLMLTQLKALLRRLRAESPHGALAQMADDIVQDRLPLRNTHCLTCDSFTLMRATRTHRAFCDRRCMRHFLSERK